MKNIKIYNTKPRMKLIPLLITGLILVTMTGCKVMDCDIKAPHAHKYENPSNLVEYMQSEYEYNGDFKWTSDVVDLTIDVDRMDKFDLLSINDNIEPLTKIIANNEPFKEYEYEHRYIQMIGKLLLPKTDYKWTTDKAQYESDLTGKVRDAKYMYYGYKIVKDENNNYVTLRSELVDDLLAIKDEYPYLKTSDYAQVVSGEPYTMDRTYTK